MAVLVRVAVHQNLRKSNGNIVCNMKALNIEHCRATLHGLHNCPANFNGYGYPAVMVTCDNLPSVTMRLNIRVAPEPHSDLVVCLPCLLKTEPAPRWVC